jgi:hypothetical protein
MAGRSVTEAQFSGIRANGHRLEVQLALLSVQCIFSILPMDGSLGPEAQFYIMMEQLGRMLPHLQLRI